MKKMSLNTSKKIPWLPISITLLAIVFFSIRLVITYDGAHYLNYVAILENNLPTSSWDIVRGPIFPSLIFFFDIFFGKTSAGILIGTFILYIIFSIACYKVCQEICQKYKHKKLIQNMLLAILILNPLIMGYFHVLLTEFVAITFTMLNILLAYKWLSCDIRNKKHLILYSIYFIFSIIFCYHLKQPYIIIAFTPPLVSALISVFHNHSFKNIAYRIGTLIVSLIFLFISILIWNTILKNIGADTSTGRDSSSLFNKQLVQTYHISYDKDNDGKTDSLSTAEALEVLSNSFTSDPANILGIYITNYCGLSSICSIESNDGINYVATLNISGVKTFENSIIGYRPYSSSSNIFVMPDELRNQAIAYGESSSRSLPAIIMGKFEIPTNLLFKASIIFCAPFLIFLILFRIKHRNSQFSSLYYLSIILLSTSFLHIALSAGIGLIIDRYAIEAFAPAILGGFGAVTYFLLVIKHPQARHLPTKKHKSQKLKGGQK